MKEKTIIIAPHKKISREVGPADIQRVYDDAKKMYELFGKTIGMYKTFFAVAHPQIEEADPLRFFVFNDGSDLAKILPEIVIINPKIIRHTEGTVPSVEGCLSFSDLPMRTVDRWSKCEVEFSYLHESLSLSPRIKMNFNGTMAKVWQHEIDHLNGRYIFEVL